MARWPIWKMEKKNQIFPPSKSYVTIVTVTSYYTADEWMNCVLGHESALLRLYWAADNLGKCDEFLVWIKPQVQD